MGHALDGGRRGARARELERKGIEHDARMPEVSRHLGMAHLDGVARQNVTPGGEHVGIPAVAERWAADHGRRCREGEGVARGALRIMGNQKPLGTGRAAIGGVGDVGVRGRIQVGDQPVDGLGRRRLDLRLIAGGCSGDERPDRAAQGDGVLIGRIDREVDVSAGRDRA